jgi:hypothetical protein
MSGQLERNVQISQPQRILNYEATPIIAARAFIVEVFLHILAQGRASSRDAADYYVMRVCFENEADVIWEGGFLKRRDPPQSTRFNIIERYVLPTKQT